MARPNNGPYLEKNARGVYEIRWTEDGRSHRKSTRTQDMIYAQKVFADWLANAAKPTTGNPTVSDVLDLYLREHVDEHTVDPQRIHDIAKRLRAGLGAVPVRSLTPDVISGYRRRRQKGAIGRQYAGGRRRGAKDSTIRQELSRLLTAIRYAVKRRVVSAEDMPHITLPPEGAPRDVWLTEDETSTLLALLPEIAPDEYGRLSRASRFILLGLATAARKSAIQYLTWDCVDLDAGLVRFDQIDRQRSNKRRVPVPLPGWVLPHLRRMKRERISEFVLDASVDVYREVARVGKRAADKTGNDKYLELTPHVLRHTRATHMARAGREMYEIAGLLGDTLATVTKTYLHHCPEHLRSAADSVTYGPPLSVVKSA